MGVTNVKQPTPEQVAFWAAKGWKHLGLGRFQNEANRTQQGMIFFHKDGRTGIKINNHCVIGDGEKVSPAKK